MPEKFHPRPENIGKNCAFWRDGRGCCYPKAELEGRESCEGLIDDICLYYVCGRIIPGLDEKVRLFLKTTIPSPSRNRRIPPGNIE